MNFAATAWKFHSQETQPIYPSASRIALTQRIFVQRRAQAMHATQQATMTIPTTPEAVNGTPPEKAPKGRPPTSAERLERVHELQSQALRHPDPGAEPQPQPPGFEVNVVELELPRDFINGLLAFTPRVRHRRIDRR
jgi:hypothetical protein